MKFAISFFGVLVLVISGMLFFQFQVYSDKLEEGKGDFSYTQEIEVVYRGETLDIRQHFKNLPHQTININWPAMAVSPDCFIESENSCKRLNEEFTQFNEGDVRSQSISYIIPLKNGLKSKQFLKDIFVTLENGQATYSTVHISTDSNILGQWVTGLPLIGQQSLSLVNYSMFSGTGPVTEIFWQAGDFKFQQSIKNVSFYSKKPLSTEFKNQFADINLLNEEHIAIVDGENLLGQQGNRILFTKDLSINSLSQSIILTQVQSIYDFGESPKWLKEVVGSFLTGSAIGNEKTKEIVMTLTNRMSTEQLQSWVEQLNELKGKKISAPVLDEALSEVFGIHTNYLSMNESSKGVFPFLFNDNREVYVDSHLKEDINVIFKDGQVFYSADNLLKYLGYTTSVGKNGYYVNSDLREYRFPKNYDFYVYNQRRYNTVSEPIVEIAGEHYVEESWLQKIFFVELEKNDTTISIKATTTPQQ